MKGGAEFMDFPPILVIIFIWLLIGLPLSKLNQAAKKKKFSFHCNKILSYSSYKSVIRVMTNEEKDIINGCKRGDQSSQEQLYRTYGPIVKAVCYRYVWSVSPKQITGVYLFFNIIQHTVIAVRHDTAALLLELPEIIDHL